MKYRQQRPTDSTRRSTTRKPTNARDALYRHRKAIAAALGAVIPLLTLIATLPGATNDTFSLIDRFEEKPASTSHDPIPSTHKATPSNQAAPQGIATTAEESPSATTGCYDGNTPTPCGSPHSREVFAKPAGSSCDSSALILYMGGTPDIDLLASGIDVKPFGNAEDQCVVERTSGMPNVSLKDIWTVDNDHNGYKDGGEFRRCLNRQGQPTSCDTDHASEEFFNAPTDVNCGKKYEEFSGRPVDHSIRVSQSSSGGNIVCRAEVQVSTDKLTASIRDLENASLPIKQG